MPKIGRYDYPDMMPSEVIEIVKVIYTNGITSTMGLATKLGHKSPKSGTFLMKLAHLRRYAVIKSGESGVSLTDLGERLAKPKPQEEQSSKSELIEKVKLFTDLKLKLAGKNPNLDFWIPLHELAGVDRREAEAHADRIKKLYENALQFMNPTVNSEVAEGGKQDITTSAVPLAGYTIIQTEDAYVKIPRNLESIKRVIGQLRVEEQILEEKENKKK